MEKPRLSEGLELESDPGRQRLACFLQRLAWFILSGIVLAALLGLFGNGLLSKVVVFDPASRLSAEYQRFSRYQAPTTLRIRCQNSEPQFQLALERAFVEQMQMDEISPVPVRILSASGNYVYVFASHGPGEQLVTFRFTSHRFGKTQTAVQLDNRSLVVVRQFYWP